jgi:hypothetical protein
MALKLYTGKNSDIKVYASDWKVFVKELKKIDPQQMKNLQKRWKEIAEDAKKGVTDSLKGEGAGVDGPMSGMRHGGRTGWGTNYGSVGSPVSGAKRKRHDTITKSALTRKKKGATGIARLIVRSAGTVLADLARGHGSRASTRMYKIREFGGPEVMRSHQIQPLAVQEFLHKLGPVVKQSKRKRSRNVYPGFDASYPKVKLKAEAAIRETIKFVEENIDRNNRS